MNKTRVACFDRINAFNAPFALIFQALGYKLFAREARWPSFFSWFGLTVTQLTFTRHSQWQEAFAQIFEDARVRFSEEPHQRALVKFGGVELDFSRLILQEDLQRFQEERLTELLAQDTALPSKNTQGSNIVIRNGAVGLTAAQILGVFRSFAALLRALILGGWKLGFNPDSPSSHRGRKFSHLIRGISPSDYPTQEGQADFSWWVRSGGLNRETTLFILPTAPSLESANFLREQKIHWIEEKHLLRWVPNHELFTIFFHIFLLLARLPYFRSGSRLQRIQLALRALPWIYGLKTFHAKTLISSLSESWPEHPAVATANALGLKTINWSYAGSSLGYSPTLVPFKDQNIWRSVVEAKHTWIWTETHAKHLQSRQLFKTLNQFHSSGPIMSGNPELLNETPSNLRKTAGLTDNTLFYLSVFDVPVYQPRLCLKEGIWPNARKTAQDGLFWACIQLLKQFPTLHLIYKRKRPDAKCFEDLPALNKLLEPSMPWNREKRITILNSNVDPFWAICAPDACLAAPYTSPVMLGHLLEKPSYFFDSTGDAKATFENKYLDITVTSFEDLQGRIASAILKKASSPDCEKLKQGNELFLKIRKFLETEL